MSLPEPSAHELLKMLLMPPEYGYTHVSDDLDYSENPDGALSMRITIDYTFTVPPEWHEWVRGFLAEIEFVPGLQRRFESTDDKSTD